MNDNNGQAAVERQLTESPDETMVSNYLRMHPNFFLDKPELLRSLRLFPEASRNNTPISLQERQQEMLRQKVNELENHIQQLTRAALDNEKLLHRWYELNLQLLNTTSLAELFEQLQQRLVQDYAAEHIVLHLSAQALDGCDIPSNETIKKIHSSGGVFQNLLNQPQASCGRLTWDKKVALFGETPVESAVLVSLQPYGVLAIGSEDVERFAPGTGVLFIELLAKTVRWQIRKLLSDTA